MTNATGENRCHHEAVMGERALGESEFRCECEKLRWTQFLNEKLEEGEESEAGILEEEDIMEIVSDAYRQNLDPEVLLASRKACQVRAAHQLHPPQHDASRKTRVLAVDDDEGFLSLITQNLQKTGRYDIRSVSCPNKALDEIEEFGPDLVILDIIMPGENGTEIADSLRESPRWAHVPVIMLTGLVRDIGRIGVEARGLLYLAKSVSPRNLVHCIEELLVDTPY